MNKWKQSINIKQHLNQGETVEQCVYAAKGVLSELSRLKVDKDDYDFEEIREFFEDIATIAVLDTEENLDDIFEEFNYRLNELYDWADANRVWLGL